MRRGSKERDLKRGGRHLVSPKAIFWIYCEGTTETMYLSDLERDRRPNVRLELISVGADPLTVLSKAKEKLDAITPRNPNKDSCRDQVWAMFDRDDHKKMGETMSMSEQSGVQLAFSNPCIELWAQIHFEDQERHIERHDCQRAVNRLTPSYDHGKGARFDYEAMKPHQAEAVVRAKNLERRRCDAELKHCDCNPWTNMHVLIEAILTAT